MMKRAICGLSMLSLVLVAGMVSEPAGAADKEKSSTIKEIMGTLHKGGKAPFAALKTALKSDSPNWGHVRKETKLYASCSAGLTKNDPPKGDKESYQKLAKAFASNARALDEAAKKEDLNSARDSFKKIGSSCAACHKSHKPS